MKIGLLSDSHGNIPYVKKAAAYLKDKEKVGLIVHLGDECEDIEPLKDLGIEIIKIPGVSGLCCYDPAAPVRLSRDIDGVKVFMTHSPEFPIDELPEGVKAVFYGHTHIAKIENKKGALWVNPGHLRESDKKDNPASFAVAEINKGKITANIIKYSEID